MRVVQIVIELLQPGDILLEVHAYILHGLGLFWLETGTRGKQVPFLDDHANMLRGLVAHCAEL